MELPQVITKIIDKLLTYVYALEKYVEPTLVLVPASLRSQVGVLSGKIGFDEETLSYTLGLFLCYPLGLIMNALPYGKIRHTFSFLLGAFLMQFTLGSQWMHILFSSLTVYAMFLFLPRNTTKILVPVFVMLYMTLGHLHRQYINYLGWDLDFTGAQMVLTQKLYMMAYNLFDGDMLARGKDNRASKKCEAFALQRLPSLIEYLGYCFCFSNVLSGPVFEFSVYKHACEGTHLYDSTGKPRGKIPSNVWPTIRALLTSLGCLATFIVVGGRFPLLDPKDPQNELAVVVTDDFLKRPWPVRFAYLWIGLLAVRQKYYFAWTNAEGACNIWYAGFEGFDELGNPKGWETSSNVGILGFETAASVSTLSKEWNKKSSLWLTRYVYIRTNGNLGAVYSLSAFWHGFYPGYYLFFLSVPLLTFCERLGRKKISPYFSPNKWTPYGVVCIITTSLVVEYMVSAFVLLALDRAWLNWKSHYFFGHMGCVIFYAVVSMLPTPKTKDKAA